MKISKKLLLKFNLLNPLKINLLRCPPLRWEKSGEGGKKAEGEGLEPPCPERDGGFQVRCLTD